ncbi:ABC transporter permease [Pseudomonas sp. 18175]|uniref:ABC transporter permease n=1 Tax=Pseudomonas sp. 18175 TaxID=3390056 RepID=UPI003D19253F
MNNRNDAALYVGPATVFLLAIILVPLGVLLYTSLAGQHGFSLEAYQKLFASSLFRRTLWATFEISLLASLASLLLGYPLAVHLARQPARRRAIYMILVLVPFWTSILVKSFAFTILLGKTGLINSLLSMLFGTQIQLPMLFNRFGVMVGMTNYLVPFIVFPVLASLLAINPALYKAAEIMGAKAPRIFFKITVPLSLPGVAAGVLSTTIMSMGFFVIPALLGSPQDVMMSNLVDFYTRETLDWNTASAIGVVMLIIIAIAGLCASRLQRYGAKPREAV